MVNPANIEASGEGIGSVEEQLTELRLSEEEAAFEANAQRLGNICLVLLGGMWLVFIAEQLHNFFKLPSAVSFFEHYRYWWLFCILPPLRLCAHSRTPEGNKIWLPKLGWKIVDRHLRRSLERTFSIPMIWIALLILPVLGLHFLFKDRIVEYPMLRIALHISTGLIWFAFTVEFIVMVSVAEKKFDYCKKHWLDLAIILLPLVSFLRTLRILRAGRLAKLGKLQQLSRVVRVYRLRGVAMRAFRALLVLELLHRVLRTKPENRIKKLEDMRTEKLRELEDIDEQIAELRKRLGKGNEADLQDTELT